MKIRISSPDSTTIEELSRNLTATLADAGVGDAFEAGAAEALPAGPQRGADPVTITQLVLTAVGAGGALTVALGKDGFFSRLAKVLESWVGRELEVTIETEEGKYHLSGSAGHIERLLKEKLKAPPAES